MKDILHNEWGLFSSFDSILPKLDAELQNLITRKLKRASELLTEDGKKKIQRSVGDFFADAEDLLMRYLPDFDTRDFVKSTQNKIQMDMDDSDLFSYSSGDGSEYGLGDLLMDSLNAVTLGLSDLAGNLLSHGDVVSKVESTINSISSEFDPIPYLEHAFSRKNAVIEYVKECFINDLIEPLQEQIQEIRTRKEDREKELAKANERLSALENSKKIVLVQITEINNIK